MPMSAIEALGKQLRRAGFDVKSEGGNMDAQELENWWRELTEKELEMLMPKVAEYSAVDLEIMGQAMEGMVDLPRSGGIEAAIAFYCLGKISRIVGALGEGRMPSEDSWVDLGIYARMAQRVRETGAWPGEREEAFRG